MEASMWNRGAELDGGLGARRPTCEEAGAAPIRSGWMETLRANSRPLRALKLTVIATALAAVAWVGARSAGALHGSPIASAANVIQAGMLPALSAPNAFAPLPMAASAGDAGMADAAPPQSVSGGILPDGRVVLNVASEEELRKLPKIGPSRARAIVALRQKLGRFRSTRDLLRIKGIGPRLFQKLQPLIVLDAPDAG